MSGNTPKIDLDALKAELGITDLDAVKTFVADQNRKAAEEAEQKKFDERIEKFLSEQHGDALKGFAEANETIKTLEEAISKNAETFAKTVETMQNQIEEQANEIKTLLARREGKDLVTVAVGKSIKNNEDMEAIMEEAAMLKSIMRAETIESTAFGAEVAKAVNSSSSIEVSDEDYETVFSSRILRDVQKRLVIGDMFSELPMSSKLLTMQIEADRASTGATWVDAAQFGQAGTVGGEHTTALTNITFSTYKLACKAYMTDETKEDAITPLLGIIRRRLVEAHAEAIEDAFLNGDGAGKPRGLVTLANDDANEHVSAASGGTATSKVSAMELLQMRRKMGRKGTRMGDLALVVSLDVYYDLLEDAEWQDVDQVGAAAMKLQGQVGRIYGLPVLVSEYFPAKAANEACAVLVYKPDFIIPRQRVVTAEFERIQALQTDAYYVTQRVNLQRYFSGDNVVALKYAA
ncbi:major head protein precursor [Vibrio phage VCPH]|nr:major head protein precursor [Vibrio phage VCPH]